MSASVSNGAATNEALSALQSERSAKAVELEALEETRSQLETAPEPIADGEGIADEVDEQHQEAAVEKFVEGDIESVEELESEIESAYVPPEQRPGFVMTDDRRVGAVTLQVDGEGSVKFGKPSGRSSVEMLGPIEEMENGDASLHDLTDYVWHTLAEWSVDDEFDVDYWADEHALLDAISLCRSCALGGNAPMQ